MLGADQSGISCVISVFCTTVVPQNTRIIQELPDWRNYTVSQSKNIIVCNKYERYIHKADTTVFIALSNKSNFTSVAPILAELKKLCSCYPFFPLSFALLALWTI